MTLTCGVMLRKPVVTQSHQPKICGIVVASPVSFAVSAVDW